MHGTDTIATARTRRPWGDERLQDITGECVDTARACLRCATACRQAALAL